jgi:hypothetical protein
MVLILVRRDVEETPQAQIVYNAVEAGCLLQV